MELNHAIGILSKLKDNAILKCLENNLSFIIWLPLGPKTWGAKDPKDIALLFKHHKTIPFRKLPLKNAEILLTCIYLHDKLCIFCLSFCVFTGTKSSNILLLSFNIFHCGHTHNYSTRSASKNILDIASYLTETYTYGTSQISCA